MTFSNDHSSISSLWSGMILEELTRIGVKDCCIAPGSRSAPLTLAAAANDNLQKHVHFDERGLAFYALGLAKSTRRPVVIITTSGTAVPNLYPAMVEASMTGWPLIVLTADRPPELIDCGANQAIIQPEIFSREYIHPLYLPCASEDVSCRWLLAHLNDSWQQAKNKGLCLHINLGLREPLYPVGELQDFSNYLSPVSRWCDEKKPWQQHTQQMPEAGLSQSEWTDFISGQGIIIAGQLSAAEDKSAVLTLSRKLGWPLLVDVQSGLHGHKDVISRVDILLDNPAFRSALNRCDRVLQFGGRFVSKRLQQCLDATSLDEYWVVDSGRVRLDPGHCVQRFFKLPAASFAQHLAEAMPDCNESSGAHAALKSIARQCEPAFATMVETGLTELSAVHAIGREAGNIDVFAGNSLSVRLLDWVGGHQQGMKITTNRGASGIDGLVATASGYAKGSEKPMILLLGDLSFLYDLNSMALAAASATPLVIVVLNNDGGSIFNIMPLQDRATATTYFRTPHNLDISKAAPLFGVRSAKPATLPEFRGALQQALGYSGCTLIEIRTPDDEALQLIAELRSCVRES